MSVHLVATLPGPFSSDPEGSRNLSASVVAAGGQALVLGSASSLPEAFPARFAPATGVPEDLRRLLEEMGMAVDETVFLASNAAEADFARKVRLKIGRLAASPSFDADESWRDLADARSWFERQSQLGKRAWPIATVGGLVFAPDDTALFVRTAKWSGTWGVPGGKIDYGEASVAAFLREIREETGLEATDPELLLVQDAIEEPEFFRPRHFLLLNYRAKTRSKEFKLNHESLEAGWFGLEAAARLALNRPTRRLVEHLLSK